MYDKLEIFLSKYRLEPYLLASNNDKDKAIELYNYNIEVSKQFYSLLSYFEIILRNVCNNKLIKEVGEFWFDNRNVVIGDNPNKSRKTLEKINETKNIIIERYGKGYKIKNRDIISNLSFGFWVNLLSSNYNNNVWRPYLRHVFKNVDRKKVYSIIDNIRLFRNRVFHHEPIIFKYDTKSIYNDMLYIIELMTNKDISNYINKNTRALP